LEIFADRYLRLVALRALLAMRQATDAMLVANFVSSETRNQPLAIFSLIGVQVASAYSVLLATKTWHD
jgi:hypothetical protein